MQADCSVCCTCSGPSSEGSTTLQEAVPGCVRSVFQCIATMPGDMLHSSARAEQVRVILKYLSVIVDSEELQ
jgi:hypothetical protein